MLCRWRSKPRCVHWVGSQQVDGNWDVFNFFTGSQHPSFQSHENMLMYASVSLLQRSWAPGAVWADKGHSVKMRICFPPQVRSFSGEWVGEHCHGPADADLLLRRAALGVVGRLTGLFWYPSPWAAHPTATTSYTEKCYKSRRDSGCPQTLSGLQSLLNLGVSGKGVWTVPFHLETQDNNYSCFQMFLKAQLSVHGLSSPIYRNNFTIKKN